MKLSKTVINELERILATNSNVVGYSATAKRRLRRGKKPETVIRIYVEKLPKGKISPKLRLPRTIGGLPVDVMALGKLTSTETTGAQQLMNKGTDGHIEKYRPLKGGISVVHAKGGAGTLGYFLRDNTNPPAPKKPQWYILSCAHVLDVAGSLEETIQPSPNDEGQYPGDLVGKLTERVVNHQIDAAIAKIDTGAVAAIVDGDPPKTNKVVTEAMVRDQGIFSSHRSGILVQKSGRTTGCTWGWIIDGNLRTGEFNNDGRMRSFKDCLLIETMLPEAPGGYVGEDFALKGDSGSLLVDSLTDDALGLIFAAYEMSSGVPSRGVACRMEHVLAAFPGRIMVKPGESWP